MQRAGARFESRLILAAAVLAAPSIEASSIRFGVIAVVSAYQQERPPPPVEKPEVERPAPTDPEPAQEQDPDKPTKPPPQVEKPQVERPQGEPSPRGIPPPPPPKPEPQVEGVEVEPTPAGEEKENQETGPPVEEQQVETPPIGEGPPPPSERLFPGYRDFSGLLQTTYQLRATHQESDQDFFQSVLVNWGDPRFHKVTFNFQGRLWLDFDEQPTTTALVSIQDTYDGRLQGRLQRAHWNLHHVGPLNVVRVGRQELFSLPEVQRMDGAFAETESFGDWSARFRAFAGIPVHAWESSPSGDSIFGGGVELEPFAGTWMSLDLGRVRDSLALSTERDEFGVFRARQRISDSLTLSGTTTFLDGNFRDYEVIGNYLGWDGTLGLNVSIRQLLKTQRLQTTEFDPYFQILGEERPYATFRALAWKDFGEQISIETGLWVRELTDDDDEGVFNHDFIRAHVTPTIRWPEWDAEVSVTGEIWKADDQSYRTLGAFASKTFAEKLRVEVGSEYSLYKFNPFLADEDEDVRTWYLRTRYDARSYGWFDVDLSYQRDDRDTYRIVRVKYTWRF